MLSFLLSLIGCAMYACAGYYLGKQHGYKEGVDMCLGTIEKNVKDEMEKQLIGKMEMFSQNIKEAAYELRQSNKEREGMAQEGQGMS